MLPVFLLQLPESGQVSTLPMVLGFFGAALLLLIVMLLLRRKLK